MSVESQATVWITGAAGRMGAQSARDSTTTDIAS